MLGLILSLILQAPLNTLRHIYQQQIQIDTLQARLDGPNLYAIVTIDSIILNSQGNLDVTGWSFKCGEPTGTRLVVMIDGIQSVQAEGPDVHFTHTTRTDVANAQNNALCAQINSYVPTVNAGYFTPVDISAYLNGWNSDGWHTVQVRLYDNGGKMAQSVKIPFFKSIQ